ncbi:MAG TPA: hypothetical protein VHM72_09970 [Solirubrobacteraceae bacterium]|nr:hypothetical protein [Solirubrobacteraceae bacterium]
MTFVLLVVGLAGGAAPAQASSGNWCYDVSLSAGQNCYSSHESNLYAIQAWSFDSIVWAWMYNQSASPSSISGYCSADGCTESLNLNTGGYGYQELKAYSEPVIDPDAFFGTWHS